MAHHMAPDAPGLSSPNGSSPTNNYNLWNNSSSNELFDSHIHISHYRVEGELGKGFYLIKYF